MPNHAERNLLLLCHRVPLGPVASHGWKDVLRTLRRQSGRIGSAWQHVSHLDPTICAKCATDWGNNELLKVGGLPYCPSCREQLFNFPFPQWLKAGLAVSLLLLVVALAHGARYFGIGHELYRGERLLKAQQYAEQQSLSLRWRSPLLSVRNAYFFSPKHIF
jgi:hypothetical protein